MCSGLDDSSCLQNQDPIRVLDRREAMGNDDRGAPGHQPFDCLLDQDFRFGIER